ncbi:hypothetical protein A4S06_11390 [Erysipelotrichaceae bacterium MTC7]|nr:hypothetical protein A4S06_11390 [Erysipelotrichaceae bacterium MTC7]
MLRLDQVKLSLQESENDLQKKILKKLKIRASDLQSFALYRKNIDARHHQLYFSYSIDVCVKDEKAILAKKLTNVRKLEPKAQAPLHPGIVELHTRPIIVGFGPAGMFCALQLAQMGYRPRVFERGSQVEKRIKDVDAFYQKGVLNEESNIQFGEGGAGTFSDGKLTARTKDVRVQRVYDMFVQHGAPNEILYDAYPHIGSDILVEVTKRMREEIIALGGSIHFDSKVEALLIEADVCKGIIVNKQEIYSDVVVLALGNSSRDSFQAFHAQGVLMESKPFAVGVRIEHTQKAINEALYHSYAGHDSLPQASYRLTHNVEGTGVYTFCMCPGGQVVAATSKEGHVVVNGMSNYARDKENANAAILVQVDERDYGEGIFKGMEFQEKLERLAYTLGGSNYKAPAQRVSEFLEDASDGEMIEPSYPLGVTYTNLRKLLPANIVYKMQEGIKAFQKKNAAFKNGNAILTGVETRSSSPIRICRNEKMESTSTAHLYPIGEGSGYAGGITSSAIDGLKCAEVIISKYNNEGCK